MNPGQPLADHDEGSVLIAGVGNIFNGDDGFGVAVARKLARSALPANVRVVDYGIRGIDLAFALMDGYSLTIIVDAASRGSQPGTIYTIEPNLELLGEDDFDGTHGLDSAKVLAMAKRFGSTLGRVLLVGCEPQSLEECMELSPPVEAAIDTAIEVIQSRIEKECITNESA